MEFPSGLEKYFENISKGMEKVDPRALNVLKYWQGTKKSFSEFKELWDGVRDLINTLYQKKIIKTAMSQDEVEKDPQAAKLAKQAIVFFDNLVKYFGKLPKEKIKEFTEWQKENNIKPFLDKIIKDSKEVEEILNFIQSGKSPLTVRLGRIDRILDRSLDNSQIRRPRQYKRKVPYLFSIAPSEYENNPPPEVIAPSASRTAGFSSVLYHWCNYDKLFDVLETNEIKLNLVLGTDSDIMLNKNRFYYLSMTRSKLGGYHFSKGYGVVLVLDGRALGNSYSGGPVDYWGANWRDTAWKSLQERRIELESFMTYDEKEDRLVSNQSAIKPANKYIKEIHVMKWESSGEGYQFDFYNQMKEIESKSNELGIRAYFYENEKDFKLLNKNKAKSFNEINLSKGVEEKDRWRPSRRSMLGEYFELYEADSLDGLSERAKKLAYNIGWYKDDKIISLKADIHNMGKDLRYQEERDRLVSIFKKEGIRTVKEFIEILAKKADYLYNKKEKAARKGY
ncbi:MAG: hypothetical protein WC549_09680 [Actinomycetota bacterium]